MAQEQVLAKGLRFFNKHEKAPDFVIGTLIVTLDEVKKMFDENREHLSEYNGSDQLKLQILKSKKGELYAAVDTYKPTGQTKQPVKSNSFITDIDPDDSLPF